MFADELNKIKNAEEQAEEMKREAKISAKNLTDNTSAEVTRIIDEAFAVEREECRQLIREGQEIAQKRYDEAIEDAQTLCGEMIAGAEARRIEAVKFIAERIVRSSVDY